MMITNVRVHLQKEEKLKAFASVTFDDVFVVHNIKVVSIGSGEIVCMPSRRLKDGTFKDIAHPITKEFREKVEQAVLQEYKKCLEEDAKKPEDTK
mgnify:CR=1 FL=1